MSVGKLTVALSIMIIGVSGAMFFSKDGFWGSGSDDCWVVGRGGTILHWTGAGWNSVLSGTTYELDGVWGSGPSDVWAVGTIGTSGTIVHWNGSAWSVATSSAKGLYGVWGSGPSDVWAVGDTGTILHWNGSTWTGVASGTTSNLRGVWGSGPADAWTVGSGGVMRHWNGTTWSGVASGTSLALWDVWGNGPADIWAVSPSVKIIHSSGSAGVASDAPNGLYGVWGSRAADVWMVGVGGLIRHWDGTTWSTAVSSTAVTLRGVWGSGTGDVWAVGDSNTIVHHDFGPPRLLGGACPAPISLYCGTNTAPFVQTGSISSTAGSQFSSYSCNPLLTESSGEVIYKLDAPVTGTVTVTLTPSGGDLDLVALGADSFGGCDTSQCKSASQIVGANLNDSITLTTTQGQTLYFVVDGPTAGNIGFTLATKCTKL